MRSTKRSTRQIRKSLHDTRERLDRDLAALQGRAEESVSPSNILARHPAIMTIAGAIVGLVLIRNPAIVTRTLTRVAQASTPFLMRALFQRGSSLLGKISPGADAPSEPG